MTRFDDLMHRWDWRAIPNCPGRYRLQRGKTYPRLEELVEGDAQIQSFRVVSFRWACMTPRRAPT